MMRKTPSISAITSYLFIGRQPRGLGEYEVLKKLEIGLIINMVAGSPPYPDPPPVKTIHIATHDSVLRKIHLHAVVEAVCIALEAINTGNSVFVHCSAGRHRSVAVGAAILVAEENLSIEGAMDLIKAMRPEADPYARHIQKVIKEFEKYWAQKKGVERARP